MKKKVFAIMLTAIMILAMIPNTFAGNDTYSITINNSVSGYTYAAYQIFKGDLSGSTLSNIQWGDNIDTSKTKDTLGYESAADYARKLAAITDDAEVEEEADKIAKCIKEDYEAAATASSLTNNTYVLSNLAAGYYLVKNTAIPAKTETDSYAYTDYILKVVDDVSVDPKESVPSVEKKILEGTEKLDANEASIGDTVYYEITGKLPSTLDDYNTYYYKFTDTLSKGLTYTENSIKITVNEIDVTNYFYVNASSYDKTSGTTITVAIADILALSKVAEVGDVTSSSEVVVTYSATLNENANIGTANDNDVTLTYSNDPNNSGTEKTETAPSTNPSDPGSNDYTGVTPKSTVSTYTTEITISKTNGSSALEGAAFKLTGDGVNIVITTGNCFVKNESATTPYYKLSDGTYTTTAPTTETKNNYDNEGKDKYELKTTVTLTGKGTNAVDVEAFVDSNGKLTFTGLGAGTYTITETVTPKGYNSVDPVTFTVSFAKDSNSEKYVFSTNNSNVTVTENKLATTIVNSSGSVLPSTGGIGTTIFYVLGGILVLGAVVYFITRRRMTEKN